MGKSKFCIILLAVISIVACSRRPSEVMDKESLAQLMADVHTGESVVESSSRSFRTDSAKRAFLQSIYAKHGVTTEIVDSSLSWYGYNVEKYLEVYDRTIEILEERLERQQDLAGTTADGLREVTTEMQGDSVDVWPGIRYRRFSATMPNNLVSFNLRTDRNWERGDVYTLRAKIMDNRMPLIYSIAVEYNDGKREYISKKLIGDGWHELKLVLDSAKAAQRVYGYINYDCRPGELVFVDSISLYRTRWGGHYRQLREEVVSFENRTLSSGKPQKKIESSTPADLNLKKEITGTKRRELLMLDNNASKHVPISKAPLRPGLKKPQK